MEKEKFRIREAKFPEKDKFQCSFCSKVYFTLHGLRTHMEKAHKEHMEDYDEKPRATVTCPLCHELFRTGYELSSHCNEAHNGENDQDFSIIEGVFASEEEFNGWMDSVECLTKVRFMKRTSRACRNGRNHLFVCEHARGKGDVVDPKEMQQRFSKSKRVHSHCPAFVKIVENHEDGSNELRYVACLGHLGHKIGHESLKPEKYTHKHFNNHQKHKEALRYYGDKQDMIVEFSDNTWVVVAEGGEEHCVSVGSPCRGRCDNK
ncbi:zinc finger, C2H2 type, partial [Ostertagia ostertagi]